MAEAQIATVIGARPQFIKASAVSAAFAEVGGLREAIIHTGQHYDPNMSDVFFAELGIPKPAVNLDIHGGGHGEMTGRMLEAIEKVLLEMRPAALLVYGDTNSTLAGALAASKLHIPIAHVEAGLRSFNMAMPEEVNRILTDRISDWLFAPTAEAERHLLREGTAPEKIYQVGDVMLDVARRHGNRVSADDGVLQELGLTGSSFALVTVHRAENTDVPERLVTIVSALRELARELPIVWPVHPRTKKIMADLGLLSPAMGNVHVIEPLGYLDMVRLEKFAALIATDSGGVQKEAFFHEVPCVTLRDETEWTELVDAGWNRLAPPVALQPVVDALSGALGSKGTAITPYGAGDAAKTIARVLKSALAA